MKKAIALLLTIATVLLLSIIIIKYLTLQENIFNQSNSIKNLTQRAIVIQNIQNVFVRLTNKINNQNDLENIFTSLNIVNDNIDIHLEISPLSNKLNINYIFQSIETFSKYKKIINHILVQKNILDIDFFYDLILDTIDSNEQSIHGNESEIIRYDKDFKNGGIYNSKHFEKILKYYITVNGDENIIKATKNLFFFEDKKYNKYYPNSHQNIEDENNILNKAIYKRGSDFLVLIDVNYKIQNTKEKLFLVFNMNKSLIVNISKQSSLF